MQGRPISEAEVRGTTAGYFDVASERLSRAKALAIQEKGLTQEREMQTERLNTERELQAERLAEQKRAEMERIRLA